MSLHDDFKEFIELLNANCVEYLLVGGYAVSYYSQPKFTQDIDFWINPSGENAKKMIKVLAEFGFASLNITEDDLTNPDMVIQLGRPPMRIDIITAISGLEFNEAYPNRTEGKYFDVNIMILGKQDLLKNKKLTGREKDRFDIDWIKKYSNKDQAR